MGISIKKCPVRKDGRSALILQYYYGLNSSREKLNAFVYISPKTREEKDHNKSAMLYAEGVRVRRLAENENGSQHIFANSKNQGSFLQYFKKLAKGKANVEGSYSTWRATYKHLEFFTKGRDLTFSECNDDFLKGFRKYLLNCKAMNRSVALSTNSANIYFSKVKAALNEAISDKIMNFNPGKTIKNIKMDETFREFLSETEIRMLCEVKCKVPLLKTAFLFSCQTGLRWSDVKKLKWGEIRSTENQKVYRIHYAQQKTKSKQYHPISADAVALLGVFGGVDEVVFKDLDYSAHNNEILANWIKEAGIDRHITFHCARHSYAIMMLIATNDIYTVSKLLGHKDIKTTLIYARIVNATANKAVDLFPDFSF